MTVRPEVLETLQLWVRKAESDFGKTHDLNELSRSLPSSDPMPIGSHECGQLSSYAVASRYPSDSEITLQEANQAAIWMDKIRDWARTLLPKTVLS